MNVLRRPLPFQSDHCTADCYKVNCEKTWGAVELLRAGLGKASCIILVRKFGCLHGIIYRKEIISGVVRRKDFYASAEG